jgi:hypothetical protein
MRSAQLRSKNHRPSRLQVELLESRVQPSFLTGGLDLGADFGDDLFNDHRHDHLASLASALAAPSSPTAVSSGVSAASNAGAAGSVAPAASSAGAPVITSAHSLAATVSTSLAINPHAQGGPTAVAATTNQVQVSNVTDARDQFRPTQFTATVVQGNGGGIGTRTVTWAQYQGDPSFAQWNDVVTGTGASAGDVFYVGTVTDQNGNAAAGILRIQADGTIGATSYLATFSFPFSTFTQPDSFNHAVLDPTGATLYLTGSFSDNVNGVTTGYDGVILALDDVALTGNAQVFGDATLNGVTLITTATGFDVGVSGKANNPTSSNATDLLVARFDSGLTTPSFAFTYQFAGATGGLSASSDSSGNMYAAAFLQLPGDSGALYAKFDSTGMIPTAWGGGFVFGSNTPGPNSAMKGVVESGGFIYLVGTLNSTTPGPYQTDMIIAKANDADGTLSGQGYGWHWFNTDATGAPSGDINAMGEQVRNGQQFITGGNFDLAPDPGEPIESAFLFQMSATGAGLTPLWFGGSSTTNPIIGYGIAFATSSGTDVFFGGGTTATDLPVTNGSTYGGGTQDAFAGRAVI